MTAQTLTPEILAAAHRWLEVDPDPETRAELAALLSDTVANAQEIAARFTGRLTFGTAGLRAPLGAGPQRMNRVVVMQTTAGLAKFLLKRAAAGKAAAQPHVVVGFDARKNSDIFARDTAQVLAGYGIKVTLLPGPLPTPITAFAVRHYRAAAGVMITASHNPYQDNGYKLYLGDADNGSQIIPPQDAEIAAEIAKIAAANFFEIKISDNYQHGSDYIFTEYIAATLTSARTPETLQLTDSALDLAQPTIVYTALHGVGAYTTNRLFELADLLSPIAVPQQALPDALFPTAPNPNPENPHALELVLQRAQQMQADLILAHDPDADRLAVGLPARDNREEYVMLTGNQLGLILGWQAAKRAAAQLQDGEFFAHPPTLANTIVSSPALAQVAKHYGLNYAETLSGFKWVSRVPGLIFGFEEALGYLINPEIISDKDGISAALAVADLAGELYRNNRTFWDLLDEAAELFGAFASAQVTVEMQSAGEAAQLLERVRTAAPQDFAGCKVTHFSDLALAVDISCRGNVLRFDLEGGSRIMLRPSGTEPKLKVYIDARAAGDKTAAELHEEAAKQVAVLRSAVADFLQQLTA